MEGKVTEALLPFDFLDNIRIRSGSGYKSSTFAEDSNKLLLLVGDVVGVRLGVIVVVGG